MIERQTQSPIEVDDTLLKGFSQFDNPERIVKRGKTIYSDGDDATKLYYLVNGLLEISQGIRKPNVLGSEDRRVTTDIVKPGNIVGWDTLEGGLHTSTATAVKDSRIMSISASQFAKLMEDPIFVPLIYSELAAAVDRSTQHAMLIQYGDSKQRTASALLELSESKEVLTQMSRVAQRTGMARESLYRNTLPSLAADGLIQLTGRSQRPNRHVKILSEAGLQSIIYPQIQNSRQR